MSSYVPPPSFYDIFPNDFQHWSFASPAANRGGEAPAEAPRYGLQNPDGGVPAPVLTTTPAEAPAIQVPSPVEIASSSDSSSEALTPPSSQSTPPDSSAPSYSVLMFQDLTKKFSVGAKKDAQTTKRRPKKEGGPRRRRGPNRRCKGSGYTDLLNKLPLVVQYALEQEYPDCCEIVKGKDPSTVQKHRLAKRHFNKMDPKYQSFLPAFTCPAFVGLHSKCKNAKAGRYDSTERHCNNCPGFQEIQTICGDCTVFPFEVTQEEFDSIQRYRRTLKSGDDVGCAPEIVTATIAELHEQLTKLQEENAKLKSQSQPGTDSQLAAEELEPSSSLFPMDPSSSAAQPQQLFQFLPQEPFYGLVQANGEQQVAAMPSLMDPFGGFNTFAAGPGVLFGPPFGQYPANPSLPSTWPNAPFDPAAFGPLFK